MFFALTTSDTKTTGESMANAAPPRHVQDLVVRLDLDVGSGLAEEGVDVAALGERALGRRSGHLGVVGLGGSVCLELRRELRRRRHRGRLGSSRVLELADLALVRVGSLCASCGMGCVYRGAVGVSMNSHARLAWHRCGAHLGGSLVALELLDVELLDEVCAGES